MEFLKRKLLPVLSAAVWICLVEFVRNELLVKSNWTEHYQELGLEFPAETVNNIVWGLWSLLFAILIFILSRKFSAINTTLVSWFAVFPLMWVAGINLGFIPAEILLIAVPTSLIEAFIAVLIVKRLSLSKEALKNNI